MSLAEHYKVLVSGSRELSTNLDEYLKLIVNYFPAKFYSLVEGEARGADTYMRDAAIRAGWTIIKYEITSADWQRYGKSAGHRRNADMIKENCDIAIFFPIGISKGTYGCLKGLANYTKEKDCKLIGAFVVIDGITTLHSALTLQKKYST